MLSRRLLYSTLLVFLLPSTLADNFTDFLIVGGGTSGCVLAARLCTAFPGLHVTLLERGLPRSPNSEFLVAAPRKLYQTWSDRSITEFFESLPDEGLGGRVTPTLTGTTLGGSSAINGMQWTVPTEGSVEEWGISGLDTATAASYYRRAYDAIGFAPPQSPLQYAGDYVSAGLGVGFLPSDNPISQPATSVWQNRLAIDQNFRRNDACTAYVSPVQSGACSQNLMVVQAETADTIIMQDDNGNGKRAVAVETISSVDRVTRNRYWARQEVISSAGPYGSPTLLQRSGIGSGTTLAAAGVTQKVDLPVGEGSVTRASAGVSSTFTGVPDEPVNDQEAVESAEQRAIWEAGNGGLLGTPVTAANGRTGDDGYFTVTLVPFFPGEPELRTGCYHNTNQRGFIRIADANAFSTPLLKNNLLSDEGDVQRLVRCLQKAAEIHQNFPARFGMRLTAPENGVVDEEYVRQNANTGAHIVGGCAVGDVLTGELKVKGVNGLRVVDASAIPQMPRSAGPAASVYMLAEFMSDRIIAEFGERSRCVSVHFEQYVTSPGQHAMEFA
ncbi:Glucose-methanol-choline oxidoreductase [Gracilaria domingensis]|nr:Glucose-methanol-choline oxidoreductase [Gracilaria domingensis]